MRLWHAITYTKMRSICDERPLPMNLNPPKRPLTLPCLPVEERVASGQVRGGVRVGLKAIEYQESQRSIGSVV
jgi:hypothetical protein